MKRAVKGSLLSRFSRCWRSAVRERLPSPSPASSQNGEGLYSVNEGPSADINNGAGTYLATNTYAMGLGPVRESRGEPYEYHGTGKVVAADGTSYSADDDWTLS